MFSIEERVILLAVALQDDDDDNWLSVGLGGPGPRN